MYLTRNMGPIKGAGGWKKYLLGAPGGKQLIPGMQIPGSWGNVYKNVPGTSGILGVGGPLGKFGLTQGASEQSIV